VGEPSESVYRRTAVDFIIAELDLAFTFCQVALSTDNPAYANRNIENAKRALQAASKAEKHRAIRSRDKQIFAEKSLQVESLLMELARQGRKSLNLAENGFVRSAPGNSLSSELFGQSARAYIT